MKSFFAKTLFDGEEWLENCQFSVDDHGIITHINANSSQEKGSEVLDGYVLPSMLNVHSHAFQRAMAGLTEKMSGANEDSFWTWREVMYNIASQYTPDDVYEVALKLYKEMIHAGYNWVGEFHYLHHQPDGAKYDNPYTMCDAIISAAEESGIGLTLLPALYSYAGFGEQPPEDGQRRFIHSSDDYCKMIDYARTRTSENPNIEVGLCFHSLRATSTQQRADITNTYPDLPVHIHIAEQEKEVADCIEFCGQRPVEYLYDSINVDEKWTLIHATHLNDHEIDLIADSGAVAGLCPTTEANLGDGLFPLQQFLNKNGKISIGSDSHISIDVVEELRWLEYGQRLHHKKRSITTDQNNPFPAKRLYQACLKGGAQSMNVAIGALKKGQRADFIVLNKGANCFDYARNMDDVLDCYIFARQSNQAPALKHHYIAGQNLISS